MNATQVIIIGAGPAGLICAIRCASNGLSVLILEKNDSAGKKLLLTGSRRCNITHSGGIRDFLCHYGENKRFVKSALFDFTNDDVRHFFDQKKLKLTDDGDGKLFPTTNKSSDVVKVLLDECAKHGVTIEYNSPVKTISRVTSGFEAVCNDGGIAARYVCKSLVVAVGGASYPLTGSCGDGYAFAKNLGHSIVDIAPALAPLIIKDFACRSCAGISLQDTKFSLYRADKKIRESQGDVLFTHVGLSGPGILDLSRYVRADDVIKIALVKSKEREAFEKELLSEFIKDGKRSIKKCLSRYKIPERLLLLTLSMCGTSPDLNAASIDKKARARIADALTGLPFAIDKTGDFSEAMVTRGGVALHEINRNTMGSRIVSGLYFVGEVVAVDGDTGGYNLQFAFSSGMLAAKDIIKSNS
jgi:predicted Rossmann fold flavoprotein